YKLDMQDKLRRVGNRYILTETQIEQIKLYLSEDNEEKIQSQSQKLIKSPKTPKSQNSDDDEDKIQLQSEKLIKSPKTPKSQNDIMQKQLSALYDQLAIKDKQIQMLQEQFLAQGQVLQEQLTAKDKQIQLLQEQLIAKDNQIGQITVAMENLTASLNAEQALHAGTIQKQLAEHSVMEQTSDTEQSKQKQGFFARLFGKKEN
ncbi:MAG: hypothetical protein IJQ50_03005, partial [Clostridia bacterium]|nr:hypothetical protein [Clostridia bacterium]